MSIEEYVSYMKVLEAPDGVLGWHEAYIETKAEKLACVRGKNNRLNAHQLGLITDKEVYEGFRQCVEERNEWGFMLRNKKTEETRAVSDRSRWGDMDSYLRVLKGRIKKKLVGGKMPIMISLSIQPRKVIAAMPKNTNLSPIAWCLGNIGSEITKFLKRLRAYQIRNELKWSFVGWVLEVGNSGYPNVHIIFAGRWVGRIQDIQKMWPWSEPQGVDISDVAKLKRRHPEKKYTELNLANYVTKYVSKAKGAVRDGKVHRSWAWVWFFGCRMFNLAHEYQEEKPITGGSDWEIIGRIHILTGKVFPFRDYGVDLSENSIDEYDDTW